MGEYLQREYEKVAYGDLNKTIAPYNKHSSHILSNFFSNIFSITEKDEIHYRLSILGVKFSFPKPKYAKKRKENPFHYYKKNNIDITTVPPATGEFRYFQLATLAILLDFDKICKQNNIHYWLDFGTLIGAIRHKGFIPWDDDIDLGIFREDYEKIMDIVNNNTINPDVYADWNTDGIFIKIKHKKCKDLFLDLFPVDKYGEIISTEEQLNETKKIHSIITELRKIRRYNKNYSYIRELIAKYRKEKVLIHSLPKDITKMQYVWGLDFPHSWKNWFTNYDVYFPFKTIEFEGFEFPCMNKPDDYLRKVYGDYMAYPRKMRFGHNVFNNRSNKELQVIKELAERCLKFQ